MKTEYKSFDNQKFKTEKECLEYEEVAKRLFEEKSIYWIDSCGKLHQEGDIADFIYEARYVYLPNKDAVKDFKYFVPIWLRGKWYQANLNKVEEPGIYFRSQTSAPLFAEYIPIDMEIKLCKNHLDSLEQAIDTFKDVLKK